VPAVEAARDTIPSSLPDSGEFACEQIDVAPELADHAPRYVERVLGELRTAVAGLRCPVHDCGPSLTLDFGFDDAGTLDVVGHNCCAKLDEVVSNVLGGIPLFRLMVPR